jgi:hypothetical protein
MEPDIAKIARKPGYYPLKTLVAAEQVRAAPEHQEREFPVNGEPVKLLQFVNVRGFRVIPRGPAYAECGVVFQRFINFKEGNQL